jgi:hypothetical protein
MQSPTKITRDGFTSKDVRQVRGWGLDGWESITKARAAFDFRLTHGATAGVRPILISALAAGGPRVALRLDFLGAIAADSSAAKTTAGFDVCSRIRDSLFCHLM